MSAAPVQPFLFTDRAWIEVKDGNDTGFTIFSRHYTFREGRKLRQFVGPGNKLVLLTPDARALFVWRRFKSDAGEKGINCAVFRNEGAGLSSDLIRAADDIAWERWPQQRHYTYVDPKRVRSSNPGYCFLKAGWRKCGITKHRKLLILERLPDQTAKGRDRGDFPVSVPTHHESTEAELAYLRSEQSRIAVEFHDPNKTDWYHTAGAYLGICDHLLEECLILLERKS